MAPKSQKKAKAKAKKDEPEKDVEMAPEDAPKEEPKEEEPKAEEPKAEGDEAKDEPAAEEEKVEPVPEPKKKEMDVEWSAEPAADKRPKLKVGTSFSDADAMPSLFVNDNFLSTTATHGFNCLLSGARANTGIKGGRYLCEYTIADAASQQDVQGQAWQTIRIGFGTSEGVLIPGADANSFGVDNDTNFWSEGKGMRKGGARWNIGDVVGVLLNVDAASSNANTFSVFVNGHRRFPPFALPESLHGKALFPMVAIRKAAVVCNFGKAGARPTKELPFEARVLDDAAEADCVKAKAVAAASKYEVVVPVGLPNEATFDYLDLEFYPTNKSKWVECSERALAQWLLNSGLRGNKNQLSSFKVQELENGQLLRAYTRLLASRKQNVVLMHVKKNLLATDRVEQLKVFTAPWFTKKALVALGPAPKAFSAKVKETILAAEKEKLQIKVTAEKASWERQQALKKAAAERAAAAKAAAAAAIAEAKEAAGEEKDTEMAEEPVPDPEPDWAAKLVVDASTVADVTFRPAGVPDVPVQEMTRFFAEFSAPAEGALPKVVDPRWVQEGDVPVTTGGEGFDEVVYAWAKKADAAKYLDSFKKDRKVKEKYVALVPSAFFKEKQEEVGKAKVELRKKVLQFQQKIKAQKLREAKAAAAAAKPAEEPKAEEPKAEEPKAEEPKAEGETAEGETKEEVKAEPEPEDLYDYANAPEVEPASCKDVDDTDGHGTPLYRNFAAADWTMLALRSDLHLLLKAFAADVTAKDADRKGIALELVDFYYQKYLSKPLMPMEYGQKTVKEVIEYCEDTIKVQDGVLCCVFDEEVPLGALVKATEDARRERDNRIAAGDESATLVLAPAGGKGKGVKGKGYGKGPAAPRPYGTPAQAAYGAATQGGYQTPYGQKRPLAPAGPASAAYAKRPRPTYPPYGGKGYGGYKGYGK